MWAQNLNKEGIIINPPSTQSPRQQQNCYAVRDALPRRPCSHCDSFAQLNKFFLPQNDFMKHQIYLIKCIFNSIHPVWYTFYLTVPCHGNRCLVYKFSLCKLSFRQRSQSGSESELPKKTLASVTLGMWGDSAVFSLYVEPFFTIQKNSSNLKWPLSHLFHSNESTSLYLLSAPHL